MAEVGSAAWERASRVPFAAFRSTLPKYASASAGWMSHSGRPIRPGRNACLTQVSYDGQAHAQGSLAPTDRGRPAIDTIDLQGTRETITIPHSDGSGGEAQVQGL